MSTALPSKKPENQWPGHGFVMVFFAVILTLAVITMTVSLHHAALPDEASGTVLVVFEPSHDDSEMFNAMIAAGGKPLRKTWLDFIWVVAADSPGFVGRLKQHGAIGVYDELPFSPQLAGCFAYVDAKTTALFKLN